jgi:hypothetical protein
MRKEDLIRRCSVCKSVYENNSWVPKDTAYFDRVRAQGKTFSDGYCEPCFDQTLRDNDLSPEIINAEVKDEERLPTRNSIPAQLFVPAQIRPSVPQRQEQHPIIAQLDDYAERAISLAGKKDAVDEQAYEAIRQTTTNPIERQMFETMYKTRKTELSIEKLKTAQEEVTETDQTN